MPRDRGQAALLTVVVAAALFISLSVAAGSFGVALIERTRAQTAADAAALAAVGSGRAAARELAERHGASLVRFSVDAGSGSVTVEVRWGSASATAVATDAP
jgi:uncharacterized membrane protein